jgi:hypothetical protein
MSRGSPTLTDSSRGIPLGFLPHESSYRRPVPVFDGLVESTARRNPSISLHGTFGILSAASRDLLNPLPPPCWHLKRIREILRFVDDLAVAELHNAHRVCRSALVHDCILRDPEIPVPENALHLEAGRLAG